MEIHTEETTSQRDLFRDLVDLEPLGIDPNILRLALAQMKTEVPNPNYDLQVKKGMVQLNPPKHGWIGSENNTAKAWIYNEIGYGPRKLNPEDPRIGEYTEIINNMVKKTLARQVLDSYNVFGESEGLYNPGWLDFNELRGDAFKHNPANMDEPDFQQVLSKLERVSKKYQVFGTAAIIGPAGSGKTTLLKNLKNENLPVVDEEFRHLFSNQIRGFQVIEFPHRKEFFLFSGDTYFPLSDIPEDIMKEQITAMKKGDIEGSTFLRLYAYINTGISSQVNLIKGLLQINSINNHVDFATEEQKPIFSVPKDRSISIQVTYFDKFLSNLIYLYKSLGLERIPEEILDILKCMPLIPSRIISALNNPNAQLTSESAHRRQAVEQGDVSGMFEQMTNFYRNLGSKVYVMGDYQSTKDFISEIKEDNEKIIKPEQTAMAVWGAYRSAYLHGSRKYTQWGTIGALNIFDNLALLHVLPKKMIIDAMSPQSIAGEVRDNNLATRSQTNAGITYTLGRAAFEIINIASEGMEEYVDSFAQEKIQKFLNSGSELSQIVSGIQGRVINSYRTIADILGKGGDDYVDVYFNSEIAAVKQQMKILAELINDKNLRAEDVVNLSTLYVDLFGRRYLKLMRNYAENQVGVTMASELRWVKAKYPSHKFRDLHLHKLLFLLENSFLEEVGHWTAFLTQKGKTITPQKTMLYNLTGKTAIPVLRELLTHFLPLINLQEYERRIQPTPYDILERNRFQF